MWVGVHFILQWLKYTIVWNFVWIRELPEHQGYLEKEAEVDKM